MKEIKKEIQKVEYVTKYEANDGTIFNDANECRKYEESAEAVLLSNFRQLQVKFVNEYEMFGVGSEEYFLSIVKLKDKEDVDLVMQLYCLFNKHNAKNDAVLQEMREKCWKAINTYDYLLVGRGCEYDGYDSFWVIDTLTDKLNKILKVCDPGSIIEIKDDLTYLDVE